MKRWLSIPTSTLGLTATFAAGAVMAATVPRPEQITLTNGNSIYQADLLRFSLDQSWLVDGVETLFTDLYFLNLGNQPQRNLRLEDLQLVSASQPASNQVNFTFSTFGGSFNFALESILLGGAWGSDRATRQETVTLTNLSNDWLDVRLFKYLDFDLQFNGPFDNDNGFFAGNTLTQNDPSGALATVVVDQTPTAVQLSPYGALLADLYNPPASTLQHSPGPLKNTDVTAAFQFDRSLAPGESAVFEFVMAVQRQAQTKTVPEPGTVIALGTVAAGLALLRRRG
ncbi:MAG: PEP-CTERM sorting domain-containing protein [Leptolyngbya sp. DLM2.Bin27]|nr:MAG: PEP-CTERM sorting domain-containing protein [Leptolyngbya sp. DLM2.Bin27]